VNPHLAWYVARAAGVVAWALVTLSVVWGLLVSTKSLSKRPGRGWVLDLHRYLGALGLVFTAVHVGAIVADTYVHFGVADVLVPLASAWHPGDVAWGVVALYLLVAVELTSLLRRRLGWRLWRATHGLSFPLFALATVHALLAGTDTARAWAQGAVIGAAMAVAFLGVARVVAPTPSEERAGRRLA
jgi:predicted ferric reductase